MEKWKKIVLKYDNQAHNMNILLIIALIAIGTSSFASSKILWEKVWEEFNSNSILEIKNADSLNVVALVGIEGFYTQVLKSDDGGRNWRKIFTDSNFHNPVHMPRSMSYPEKGFIIVLCDSGTFIKSTDDGITWKEGDIKEIHTSNMTAKVDMFNPDHGLMYDNKKYFISHDGFETYKQIYLPVSCVLLDFQMLSENFIFLLAVYYDGNPNYDEKFFKSTNGGNSWTEYYYPDYVFPMKIKFVDTLYGFTAGLQRTGFGDNTYDYIYRTTNGGETWIKVLDTLCWPPFGLEDIDVLDRKTAIAVGQFGKIYWTHDGGNSWQRDSNALIVNQLPPTMRVCIIDENTAIIGDYYNGIWRSYLATDVEEDVPDSDQMIIPNPASDFIEIFVGTRRAVSDQSDIRIFDVYGQTVLSVRAIHELPLRIDVSGFAPGMYFVRIGERVGKFVKI